jgi:hypothetical protein
MRPVQTRSILTALFLFAPGCILNTAFPFNPRFSDGDGDGKAYLDGDCDEWPGHGGRPVIAGKDIYDSLQEAVDGAEDGDVVTVCPLPGTQEYGGLTVIENKSISLVGGDDPDRIVLNGKEAGATIRVAGGALTLENLTITGGAGTDYGTGGNRQNLGGGVDAAAATGLEIVNCVIQGNVAQFGAGVLGPLDVENAETLILDSLITDNNATSTGGGVYLNWGGQIIGTSVYRNRSANAGGVVVSANTLTITASEIIANVATSSSGGGGALVFDAKLNSEASEWGQGDTNNSQNDIMLSNTSTNKTKSYNDKTSDETFSCDAAKQSCS